MDFPPESVELLSLDNRIEMVKYKFKYELYYINIVLKINSFF